MEKDNDLRLLVTLNKKTAIYRVESFCENIGTIETIGTDIEALIETHKEYHSKRIIVDNLDPTSRYNTNF